MAHSLSHSRVNQMPDDCLLVNVAALNDTHLLAFDDVDM